MCQPHQFSIKQMYHWLITYHWLSYHRLAYMMHAVWSWLRVLWAAVQHGGGWIPRPWHRRTRHRPRVRTVTTDAIWRQTHHINVAIQALASETVQQVYKYIHSACMLYFSCRPTLELVFDLTDDWRIIKCCMLVTGWTWDCYTVDTLRLQPSVSNFMALMVPSLPSLLLCA